MKTRLFITAIESLECESAFHKAPKNEDYTKWVWLFEKHGQSHALALALSELNERPIIDNDGLFERGWAAIESYTHTDLPKGSSSWLYTTPLLDPITKLKERVMRKKMNATHVMSASSDRSGANSLAPGDEMAVVSPPTAEDQQFNWVRLFSSLRSQHLAASERRASFRTTADSGLVERMG